MLWAHDSSERQQVGLPILSRAQWLEDFINRKAQPDYGGKAIAFKWPASPTAHRGRWALKTENMDSRFLGQVVPTARRNPGPPHTAPLDTRAFQVEPGT